MQIIYVIMSRTLLFYVLSAFCFQFQSICYGAALPYPFKILPQPRSITLLNGKGLTCRYLGIN